MSAPEDGAPPPHHPTPLQTTAEAGRQAGGRALVAILAFCALLIGAGLVFPTAGYLVVKAAHVVSIIAWMAGLLYLPRLFVYHTDAPHGSPMAATFAVMETRLLKVIMTPAMIVAWVLGLWLSVTGGWLAAGPGAWWLYAKIALVVALTASHVHFARIAKGFAAGTEDRPARYFRMINEVPTLLMVGIVLLVIVAKDW